MMPGFPITGCARRPHDHNALAENRQPGCPPSSARTQSASAGEKTALEEKNRLLSLKRLLHFGQRSTPAGPTTLLVFLLYDDSVETGRFALPDKVQL
jgi:hypothetical protein